MSQFYNSPGFNDVFITEDSGNGIRIVRADRQPCPVCGHPTGDCPGDSPPLDTGKVWGFNNNSAIDETLTFYVEEDYFEEREIAPGIVTKMLIHRKGKNIPLAEAKKLGLIE